MTMKICYITGSRAEYGLMKPLVAAISQTKTMRLQIIATGAHLSKAFGLTYKEIEADGFHINVKLPILSSHDSSVGVTESMGHCLCKTAKALDRLKPDLVMVMGDRYEILSAAAAAFIQRIPIAHFSGGEITQGALDDGIRHAITKLSHWHFTSTKEHRNRVIQMGEEPSRVFNVGEIGLSDLSTLPYRSRRQLQEELGIIFRKRNLLITFHPVTGQQTSSQADLKALLSALDKCGRDTLLIFTKANADAEGRRFNHLIERFVKSRGLQAKLFDSLGRLRYLSLLRQVDVVVGNSSSGLVEAPSFKKATVNIGDRQKGRVRAKSVIDCAPRAADIQAALRKAQSLPFQQKTATVVNPYGNGRSIEMVLRVLRTPGLLKGITKKFYDLETR